ncbi:hypothetical protein LXA43DRAFT_889400, partial [Ganoderma leucocontextum]
FISSTRNTRIERLWVEVGRFFCREWRAFFTRLERLHGLDRSNPHHLWLLHILFLSLINNDCRAFQDSWNAHPISGPDTNDMSPNDMRLLGQTTHGVYRDDGADVHEDVLHAVYGTTEQHPRRLSHQTGAGHPPEEEESDDDDAPQQNVPSIPFGQDAHIRHEPVPVADHRSPFDDAEAEWQFLESVQILVDTPGVPEGYGIDAEYEYEVFEMIRSGRRGRKELTIELPPHIWLPRTELWVKALHLLNSIVFSE